MKDNSSILPYDDQGFLLGMNQTNSNVKKIDQNVEEIIRILKNTSEELVRNSRIIPAEYKPPELSEYQKALRDAMSMKPIAFDEMVRKSLNPVAVANMKLQGAAVGDLSKQMAGAAKAQNRQFVFQNPIIVDTPEKFIETAASGKTQHTPRERDANGRFVSQPENGVISKAASVIESAVKNVVPGTPQGIDPTLDAINEVSTALSPVKRAAGFMLRPLTGWMKSRKRNEPLPKEQTDHNRKQIKLLEKIAQGTGGSLLASLLKGLLGNAGGLLGNLLGGAGGRKGKGNGRIGKLLKFGKGIPILGAALTALSFSDFKSQSTKEKGGTIGSLAGGTAGALAGSLFGPVGTIVGGVIGAWAGNNLGEIVAPQVKEWTDSLIAADVPSIIEDAWDGFIKSITDSRLGNWVKEKLGSDAPGGYLYRKQYGGKGLALPETPVPFGTAAKSFSTSEYAPLLDMIAGTESRSGAFGTSGYDAIYSGAKIKPSKPISQMTVGEVKSYHKQLKKSGSKSTAVGRYQFIDNKGTFERMLAAAGIKDSDVFDSTLQDKLAIHYAGGKKQLDNWIDRNDFTSLSNKTSQQWAGMKNAQGVGTYDGDGLNKATGGGMGAMKQAVNQIKRNRTNTSAEKKNFNDTLKNQATTILKQSPSSSIISKKPPVTPTAIRSGTIGYVPPVANTTVQPAKVQLSKPAPAEVIVINQKSDNITQNVGNRGIAHAITGGIGSDYFNV